MFMSQIATLKLSSDIQYLKGVGPKWAALLKKRGVHTVRDLLSVKPRAYQIEKRNVSIEDLRPDERVQFQARIVNIKNFKKIYEVQVSDGKGRVVLKYFRVPFRGYFQNFQVGVDVVVKGLVSQYRGRLEIHHPELKRLDETASGEEDGKGSPDVTLRPVYPESEGGLTSTKISGWIKKAIETLSDMDSWPDPIPKSVLGAFGLMGMREAVKEIHAPDARAFQDLLAFRSRPQIRFIFEEFFWQEMFLASKRRGIQKKKAPRVEANIELVGRVVAKLPFDLTPGQREALDQILVDLKKSEPMQRLVQGDVGSGKTIVALLAAALVAGSGLQTALMVPTEILAEQHFETAQKFLSSVGLRVGLLTGRLKNSEKQSVVSDLERGVLDVVIGTQALIQDGVNFKSLGLVVIDEQHRFGVLQRGQMLASSKLTPHSLVMTATPIPRTLAMTVYGDLDVSLIRDRPKGRLPIVTRVTTDDKMQKVIEFVGEQLKQGRQAYVIYPLVEESEKLDLKDAMQGFEMWSKSLPQFRFGLLHGKMKPIEKEAVMLSFQKREIQGLVATTVVEVGIDVPNANIIVIEHAERFGLSQLHQLRGRVGRGQHKSYCVLVASEQRGYNARQRLEVMEKSEDGFFISEQDLRIRGPGQFLGERQSGIHQFDLADLVRDEELLIHARRAAFEVLKKDPNLMDPENALLRAHLVSAHGPGLLGSIA